VRQSAAIIPLAQMPCSDASSQRPPASSPWIMLAKPGASTSGTVVAAASNCTSAVSSAPRCIASRTAAAAISLLRYTLC
jgi:hypothetical protein